MKRRIGSLLLLYLLCACLCTQALAVSPQSCAEELSAIDVFRGTDTGFELDRAPKRSEAAVMLVRLYGAEEEALSLYEAGLIAHPFEDVSGWAAPYLAWLYSEGLVRGVSETRYGADAPCRARDYALFLLRALGYQDGTDFAWTETEDFAEACGFYSRALFGGTFTRGDLALMTWLALQCPSADGSGTLLAGLTARGAIEQDAARTLEASFRKSPVHVKDGTVTLDAAAWRSACAELEITVQFESGTETLSGEALRALVAADGRCGRTNWTRSSPAGPGSTVHTTRPTALIPTSRASPPSTLSPATTASTRRASKSSCCRPSVPWSPARSPRG